MVSPNSKLPLAVKKIVFLKAGMSFDNTIYLDWIGGATSSDVQISFRDNSVTSGNLDAAGGAPTIPVFQFLPTLTYGGTGKKLVVTVLRPGRYTVCLRVLDNGGNYSMFEMEWVIQA
jgi:hypothetical protein